MQGEGLTGRSPRQHHNMLLIDERLHEPLIKDIDFEALLADKAFDIDWLRAELNERGAVAVIPPKATRKQPIDCDFHMYRWRHLVEHLFCKIKAFRRIATRYEKTDQSFSAMIYLVGTAIALR
jgi:transposase